METFPSKLSFLPISPFVEPFCKHNYECLFPISFPSRGAYAGGNMRGRGGGRGGITATRGGYGNGHSAPKKSSGVSESMLQIII